MLIKFRAGFKSLSKNLALSFNKVSPNLVKNQYVKDKFYKANFKNEFKEKFRP